MDNIVAKTFQSELTLDQMLQRLCSRISAVRWALCSAAHDDHVLKGLTKEGVRFSLSREDWEFSVEVYFPVAEDGSSTLSNIDKRAFLKRLDGHVLAAVKATNVKDD